MKSSQSSGLSAVKAPPRVSVVIPCFNHGCYIHEAVASVRAQTINEYEIIVVDDGSTDSLTRRVLDELAGDGIRVLRTINQGLASARNTGILQACGDYILPLDADDRIDHRFLELAVGVLDSNPDVGVVYGKVEFFGETAGVWVQPDYSPTRILFENMIVASAVFRRADWLLVGGYRQCMRYGWEDWDFWLSFVELGREVVKLPEVMFFYRIRDNSMTRTMLYKNKIMMLFNLVSNHKKLYIKHLLGILKLTNKA